MRIYLVLEDIDVYGIFSKNSTELKDIYLLMLDKKKTNSI